MQKISNKTTSGIQLNVQNPTTLAQESYYIPATMSSIAPDYVINGTGSPVVDTLLVKGSNKQFSTSADIKSASGVTVKINGVVQPTTNYTVQTRPGLITFTTAPNSGVSLEFDYTSWGYSDYSTPGYVTAVAA